ncbi:MAG: aminoglycoside phosphotransferase family protein, partial [Chloroflexota bacterium]|nr:aminoglycoside phosphotransferase family protein [Chloroflexota bacterium]
MDRDALVQAIDRAVLEPVVRRALDSEVAVVENLRATPLGGGIGAELGGGVPIRFTGTAVDRGAARPWSVVLKVLRRPSAAGGVSQPDPGHQFYWRREAHLYASGLLDGLPAGLATPRCYGVDEGADGVRLWLEDVAEPAGVRWSLARYGEAARHLGRFNGAYLTGRSLPEEPWLCRDLLRWREPAVAPFWAHLPDTEEAPRVRRGWPGDLAARARRLWAERDRFLAALDDLPRVLCHGDAARRNLCARDVDGATETVAIDWGQSGPQPIGTDAAHLVANSVMWARDREPANLPALAGPCFAGYLAGLEAGWTGAAEVARLSFAATLA